MQWAEQERKVLEKGGRVMALDEVDRFSWWDEELHQLKNRAVERLGEDAVFNALVRCLMRNPPVDDEADDLSFAPRSMLKTAAERELRRLLQAH